MCAWTTVSPALGSARGRPLAWKVFLEGPGVVPDNDVERRSVQPPTDDLSLLLDPLDSHEYWQVGDVLARNDGVAWIPGDSVGAVDRYWQGEDPTGDQADAIDQVRRSRDLAGRIGVAYGEQ